MADGLSSAAAGGASVTMAPSIQSSLAWSLLGIGGALAVAVVALRWNRRLRREVAQRKRSESLLHTLIDQLPDVFVLKDAKGDFLLCNQAVADLYGTTPARMTGKSDEDFGVPPELAGAMRRNVLDIMARGETEVVYEDSRDAAKGTIRHYRSTKKPLKGPDGEDQILVIAQDLTELIRAQEQTSKSEQRLQGVLDVIQEGAWQWDLDSNAIQHNAQWYRILGAEPGEIASTYEAFCERVHPMDRDRLRAQLTRLRNGDSDTYHSEHRMIRIDGRTIWVKDRGRILERGEDGRARSVIGSFSDITVQKEARRALETSEARYRRLIENLTSEYFVYTNNREMVFTYVSNSVEAMLGWTPKEFLVHYSEVSTDHPVNADIAEKTQRGLDGHKQAPYLVEALHKDGSTRWLEISETPLRDDSGQVIGLEGIAHDVTAQVETERRLRESEARFRHIFECTDAIAVRGYDRERRVIYWNPASARLYGYTAEQAMGKRLEDLLAPEPMREDVRADITAWLTGGAPRPSSEHVLQAADGSPVRVLSSHILLSNAAGEPEIYCVDIDLGPLREAQEQVGLLSQAVEQSPVSVVITDPQATIEYVNGTFERISGYSAAEVVGQHTRILKSGFTQRSLYSQLWQTISAGEPWHGEMQNRKKSGEVFWERIHIAPVKNAVGEVRHYLAVKEDITLQKLQEEKILQQAHYDSLTGLPNRFLGLDRLAQLLIDAERSEEKVAVLFLDLDDFKKINDSMGHDTGDELLIEAAKRLAGVVRSGDTIGRLGGDEFIVLLGGLHDAADAQHVAEGILSRLRDSYRVRNRELVLTTSVGIALYPHDGLTPSELLRNADSAMYHSKEQGRNTYSFFNDSMNADVSRRLLLEEQMHGAIERGEFHLAFQPQVRISDRALIGAEALLRWENPALGNVTPDEFIPIAEQTGMIIPIGRFVMREALHQAAIWQTRQPGIRLAVNLSPRQFRDPQLVGDIRDALTTSGFPCESFELEITEGVLMGGHSYIDDALAELNAMGIAISMDDFGTGYSSLSYLRSYPFEILKIDRSFINDITLDHADLELVTAAIAMAHGLGLEVIAEGVETEDQVQLLLERGCDFAQGYLFSRPIKSYEMLALLEGNEAIARSG